MWNATRKGLAAHKLRFALTGLSVLLGVAFLAATLMITDTSRELFLSLTSGVDDAVDVVVRPRPAFEGATAEPLPAAVLDTVRGIEGVAAAEGGVEGVAQYLGAGGRPIGGRQTLQLGFAWPATAELNPWRLTQGRAPQGPDELVMDRGTARDAHFSPGDPVLVVTGGAPQAFTVVGVASYGAVDSPLAASAALFTPDRAHQLFGTGGGYGSISVVAAGGVPSDQLAERIRAAVPAAAEVFTGDAAIAADQTEAGENLGGFTTFLLAFAGVALFVGWFVIANTFSIVVAQRNQELALLRALGAEQRQVLRAVLAEALVVGVLASALGLAVGFGLAVVLRGLVATIGLPLPEVALVTAPRTFVVSLAVGVGMTVLAAYLPARRASRVPPIAALRSGALEPEHRPLPSLLFGVLLALSGAGSLVYGLFADVEQPLPLLALGALGVLLGIAVLGPVLVGPFSKLIARPLPQLKGMTGVLARENVARNPRRTATTASALMIGVALVAFITVFASSAQQSAFGDIDATLQPGVLVIRDAAFNQLDPALTDQVRALPSVAAASESRRDIALVGGAPVDISAYDTATLGQVLDLGVIQGSLAGLADGGLAVSAEVAQDKGWTTGQTVPLTFAGTGEQPVVVEAVYERTSYTGDYLTDIAALDANATDPIVDVLVRGREELWSGVVRQQVEELLRTAAPAAEVVDAGVIRREVGGDVAESLNFVYALLALAVVIALIGITNTLALSILERIRELGLLRAVGMTREQVRSAVRWESLIVALLGTALGMTVGVSFAWVVVRGLADEGFTALVVPVAQLCVIGAVAAVSGVLAAVGPARRAADLDVLRAIAFE